MRVTMCKNKKSDEQELMFVERCVEKAQNVHNYFYFGRCATR